MSTPDGPTRLGGMRERNLVLVLDEIARNQPVTRARLAELTGLTKTTVSSQVTTLETLGIVTGEGPVRAGGRGRPGAPVSLAPGPVAGLGLEVNGRYLAACVVDLTRRVRLERTVAQDNTRRPAAATVAALAELADRITAEARAAGLTPAGTTVALPGVLNHGVINAPILGWDEVPAAELLGAALPTQPLPVEADNEANLAALGELWFGEGRGLGDYIHVSGETGVGAGIVISGELFRGAHGAAGEIGHVIVDPGGAPCGCGGHGCLEQVAGQEQVLRAAGVQVPDDARASDATGSPSAAVRELVRRLHAEDPRAHEAVRRAGDGLGTALVAAVNLFDPDTVVLGGLHARLGPWLLPHVRAALAQGGARLRGQAPEVRASTLQAGAAVRGAGGQVVTRLLAHPLALAD
jgi:predicted NBD/HSP70 family sugar kinase